MQAVTGKILVLGATGYIGRHLVSALLSQQYPVVATSRDLSSLQNIPWSGHPNLELHQVDLHDSGDLSSVLSDVSTVFYLVHGMASGSDFYQYELDMAHHMSRAVSKSDVERVIYLGATQPDNVSSSHLAARKATGNILRDSGKQVIELRAGIIIGSGSAAFEVMRDIVSHLPVVTAPASIRSASCPIALETMIGYLTKLVSLPVDGSPTFDARGPETISYEDQMRRFARIINKRVAIFKVPLLTPRIATHWLSLVTTVPKPIAQSLIQGLEYDLVPTGEDISSLIPSPQISFERAVESALAEESDVVRNDLWGFDPDAVARWHKGYGYYPKQAGFTVDTDASAHTLWQKICNVGGDEGYFFGDALWTLRAYMDAAIGGDALKKRRPDGETLKTGDYIDSWKVIKCEENRHLSLLFGMKAPGLGRLEFTIVDHGEHRSLDIRAWWHPAGFSGLLYWFAMMPAHLFIFRGMAFALAKKSGAKVTTPSRR
ncbi:NAD(P)-dependent oxidoreductase [Enterovibrio norvegicus FF-33]|uniref:DUF2867 domain-containing protein n=1 Tax=Enterovibrio norvegicus TaxID=188144 RepID=UPI0002D4F27B|nr:DUF2867 domain-containing protein [Enterovibrio norvegicus]OEE65907.1 NAD(P)-dependent oxidoreductase [Enterovibrio norvegicus FF-33]